MNTRNLIFILCLTISLFFINQWFASQNRHQIQPAQKIEETVSSEIEVPPDQPPSVEAKEQFFVLENAYTQIVFSNRGGAIAEINLPFKQTSAQSVVLPIEIDRIINQKDPANARFPLHAYAIVEKENGSPIIKQPTQGGYYPLLRRGIIHKNHTSLFPSASDYALNTVSTDSDLAETIYTVTQFTQNSIRFEANVEGRHIIKMFSFPPSNEDAPYCFYSTINIDGNTSGIALTSGVPEIELISGSPAPTIQYSTVQNQRYVVEKLSLPKGVTTLNGFQPDWVANSNGYFTVIMNPLDSMGLGFQAYFVPGNSDPTRLTLIDPAYDLYPANKYPGYMVHLPVKKTSSSTTLRLYAGPLDTKILKQVDATYTNPITGANPHYIEAQSFHGWFASISKPFARFLLLIMNFCYTITHSWAFAIILLTFVLRIMLYPLNAWSIKSTLKLQAVSPKLQKIQEKHKKDPRKAQIEIMQLYKEHKVNPFGGCLPLIIQMPFLIGMFDLLKSTFSLRGASFIPGWIDNLTAPDVLFSWSYPIFFLGTQFHLLPILLGVVMFFQQKLSAMQNKKKGVLTDQQKQQHKMGSIMTFVFTFLFYKFPSGLNIYWLSSMLLQIIQQYITAKRMKIKTKIHSKEILINPTKNNS